MKMENRWIITSIISGLVGGIIAFLLTMHLKLSIIISVLVFLIVVRNNPRRIFFKAFITIISMIFILNKFFFEILGQISGFYLKIGSNNVSSSVTIFLVILAGVTLILHFLEGKDKLEGTFLEINSNKIGNISGNNITINQDINSKKEKMIKRNLNKIEKIEGNNIFVFQYIDSNGKFSEERKSIEDFLLLHPLVLEKEKRIVDLEAKNELLIENKGLLDEKVLSQSCEIEKTKQEKEQIKIELKFFIKQVEGKDLSETTISYREALELFMMGDVGEALAVLDDVKMEEEEKKAIESIKKKAKTRLLKAQILRVQNKHIEAGNNFEKAVELYPCWINYFETANHLMFIHKYGKAEYYYTQSLLKSKTDHEKGATLNNLADLYRDENKFDKAEKTYQKALVIIRKLVKVNPQTYLPDLATTLSNLGILYSKKNEFDEAEKFCHEVLEIRNNLVKANSEMHLPGLASTFNNLANLYRDKNKFDKAEKTHQKALMIIRKLSEDNSKAYLPEMAVTLSNLAVLQRIKNKLDEASKSIKESLEIYQTLVKVNPQTYLPGLASTFNNLANLQSKKNELDEAEKSHKEALVIRRKIAKVNPHAYLPDLAETLSNLSVLQKIKNELDEASKSNKESLEIYQTLAKVNPQTYLPNVAKTLINLANLQSKKNELEKAKESYFQSLEILRKLADINSEVYLPDMAATLNNLAVLHSKKNEFINSEKFYKEALAIRERLAEISPQVHLHELATTQLNMSIYYQINNINKELSIIFVNKAIANLLHLNQTPHIQNYLRTAYNVLKGWNIDFEKD